MMSMKKIAILILACLPLMASAGTKQSSITLNANNLGDTIPAEIYGQFAEHLGTCIYGGLWVGPDSEIPNIDGYRLDVFNALKDLKVPVLRWPGGCFADEYHWMDGVGPKENRPTMVNNNWGGTIEDNSFGTHEFFNLCELLECEPYLSGNVGSGTVEELAKWVEYITSDGNSPMANLRRANGRDKAWKLKYLGVGNESWGCGGQMRPEFYADMYRRYSIYCRNYDDNKLYKIASGASDYDCNWTDVLMERVGGRMQGLSLHYYTVYDWSDGGKGYATVFDTDRYYWTLAKAREVESVLQDHIAIMDELDPQNRVALLLDEWGTWFDEEPGTIKGHLYQQSTMRDAFVATLSLDIFHKYTERLKMTNIAQIANVLQSMVLTKGDKMVLTPTYYVFKMYNVHQNAVNIPLEITTDTKGVKKAGQMHYDAELPMVSATASKDDNGLIHISLSNVDLDNAQEITINLQGVSAKTVTGEILTAKNIDDYNDFDAPNVVKTTEFKGAKLKGNKLTLTLPAKSIVALELK